jgi:hypothetical protein
MGYGHYEAPAPLPNITHLFDNFLLNIPGKDQDIIRSILPDPIRVPDRNAASRQIAVLLVRIPVHCIVQKIRPDPAVIQECVPLGRCAISDNLFPLILEANEKLQKITFYRLDLLAESQIVVNIPIPFAYLSRL